MVTQLMQEGCVANRFPAKITYDPSERFRFRMPRVAERIVSSWLFQQSDGPPFAPLPATSCDDLRHTLAAYQHRPADQHDWIELTARVDQIARGYRAADSTRQTVYRAWIRLFLDSPNEPLLPFALRSAARFAVPEARSQLLHLATTLTDRHAFHSVDLRPFLVRALGRLREVRLLPLFRGLMIGRRPLAVRVQAAWAIVCVDPAALLRADLPADLDRDPQFLADLLLTGLPSIHQAVLRHLNELPSPVRNSLLDILPVNTGE